MTGIVRSLRRCKRYVVSKQNNKRYFKRGLYPSFKSFSLENNSTLVDIYEIQSLGFKK